MEIMHKTVLKFHPQKFMKKRSRKILFKKLKEFGTSLQKNKEQFKI